MSTAVPDDLASRWFEYWRRHAGSREERKALEQGQPVEIQAAHDEVEQLVEAGGARAVEVLVGLAEAAPDGDPVMVGVGPVEGLLMTHGDAIVDDLVTYGRRSPAFARALGVVSVDGLSARSTEQLERFHRPGNTTG